MLRKTKLHVIALLTAPVLAFTISGCDSKGSRPKEIKDNMAINTFVSFQENDDKGQAYPEDGFENESSKPVLNILTPEFDDDEIILERTAYITSYDSKHKIPKWVAWHLTSENTDGPFSRKGHGWHEDEDVPLPRASSHDYKGSGWSRGHMCPIADNRWSETAMDECFLTTNCCPQNLNLNSGTWNQIEISCRKWANTYGDLYIVCGPILFNKEHEKIGENQVTVPEAFFKVILRLGESPKAIGFICRNTDGNRKKDLYVNSLKQVERVTGLRFFPTLPKVIREEIEQNADISDW